MRGRLRLTVGVALGASVCCAALTAASSANAQAVAVGRFDEEGSPGIYGAGQSLASRLGLSIGRRLVYSADPEERLRAVARLSSLATPEATEALLEAMESGSPLARDPAARLAVVRALAPFADRLEVRTFLVREMMDAGARRDITSGLAALVRDTAALALARRGDPQSIAALATAASLRGAAGDAARAAMVAVPPRLIDAILFEPEATDGELEAAEKELAEASKPPPPGDKADPKKKPAPGDKGKDDKGKGDKPKGDKPKGDKGKSKDEAPERTPRLLSAPVISFLGDLGDIRAMNALRIELDRSDRPTRAAAALALAKLGDASVAKVVRPWVEENDARFALAAADILVALGDAAAPAAVKRVLGKDQVKSQAVRLAYELASPATVDTLVAQLPALEASDRVRAVMALGRAGAAKKVAEQLLDPALGPAAVTALGQCPSEEARELIADGLKDAKPERRRALTRAAVLRAVTLRDRVPGLTDALAAAGASKDLADLELSALGRIALGDSSTADVLAEAKGKSKDVALALTAGAARGALARGEDDLAALGAELQGVDPDKLTPRDVALGVGLLSDEAADSIAFMKLLRLAEGGGALAPLAARALPRRADESMKDRLLALLEGTDPSVRVGLALGLASSPEKAATTWLGRAYAREDDVLVRRALIASLASRVEPQRVRVLQLARDLDPDPEVRALAAAGLRAPTSPSSSARRLGIDPALAAYFAVVGADGAGAARTLRLVLPSGLALPLVTASDGALLVVGVPFGKASLELAAAIDLEKPEGDPPKAGGADKPGGPEKSGER